MDQTIREGKYKVLRLLGKGAFAEVYLVEDRAGCRYACKICSKGRLLAGEARYQRKVVHPAFPAFCDFWQESGKGYLLMEYIPGENLENMVRRTGALSDRQASRIGYRLAESLRYLHEREKPLLFRDVKPANVMVTPEGSVKLLDFGCVCPAGKGMNVAGTPGFGAPEQFEQEGVQTVAADVYGLGRTLQEATGGKCAGLFKRVTDKCTEKEPGDRLPDMWETAELLKICAGEPGTFLSRRQRAILRGEMRVVKNVCCL